MTYNDLALPGLGRQGRPHSRGAHKGGGKQHSQNGGQGGWWNTRADQMIQNGCQLQQMRQLHQVRQVCQLHQARQLRQACHMRQARQLRLRQLRKVRQVRQLRQARQLLTRQAARNFAQPTWRMEQQMC